jgi:hypothetical protein
MTIDVNRVASEVTKQLMAEGRIVEAGWQAMRITAIAPDAPPDQLQEMRMAFYAGAQHLWGSIMNGLDPDAEPTADDERKMELIQKELDTFIKDFARRHLPTKGQA